VRPPRHPDTPRGIIELHVKDPESLTGWRFASAVSKADFEFVMVKMTSGSWMDVCGKRVWIPGSTIMVVR
jgi:hypothetical protein